MDTGSRARAIRDSGRTGLALVSAREASVSTVPVGLPDAADGKRPWDGPLGGMRTDE